MIPSGAVLNLLGIFGEVHEAFRRTFGRYMK